MQTKLKKILFLVVPLVGVLGMTPVAFARHHHHHHYYHHHRHHHRYHQRYWRDEYSRPSYYRDWYERPRYYDPYAYRRSRDPYWQRYYW